MSLWTRRSLLTVGGSLAASVALIVPSKVFAKGNLAHDPIKLPELKINTVDLKYSETQYNLETGKFYWWPISCDGEEEDIAVLAPELFSNCWIDQIVSGDDNVNEVHAQAIYSVEFDGAGSVIISFIPIRPGQYDFYTPGYENKGLKGQFLVE